jgi:Baseplate J-like protein
MERDYFQDVSVPEERSIRKLSVERPIRPQSSGPQTYQQQQPMAPQRDPVYPAQQTQQGYVPYQQQGYGPIQQPSQQTQQPRASFVSSNGVSRTQQPQRKNSVSSRWIWIVALVVFAIASFVTATFFTTNRISIEQKRLSIPLDGKTAFQALLAADSASSSVPLTFAYTEQTLEESEVAAPTGTSAGDSVAQGTVTVTNTLKDSVKLIERTRFATGDGKVYRIKEAVTVPGQGTTDVLIFADKNGASFNSPQGSSFTLPGLKDTSQQLFTGVTAVAKSSIGGGASGNQPTLSDEALTKIRETLKQRLDQRVASSLGAQTTPDITLITSALSKTFIENKPEIINPQQLKVTSVVTIRIPAVSSKQLAQTLAAAVLPDPATQDIRIDNIQALGITVATSTVKKLDLTFTGTADILWNINTSDIRSQAAGKNIAQFLKELMAQNQGIRSAQAVHRPIWITSFNRNPEKIEVMLTDSAQ